MSIMSQEAKKQLGCVLHWTGTVASSNSPKQITSYGDCKQILPFPGAGIGMFDGSGDYLAIPNANCSDLQFGSSDFTIEGYIYIKALSTNYRIITFNPVGSYGDYQLNVDGTTNTILLYVTNTGSSWTTVYSSTYTTVGWHYITAVRSGTTITVYLDGIAGTPSTGFTGSITTTSSDFYIAGTPLVPIYADIWISELRISNVARYTTNFTPPKRQLESDSNTKLLLHFNRNDTTFIDSSPSAHTITAYGDAKQLCSPCGSGVAYFDGNGDYLQLPSSVDFDFVSQDFVVACWFNPTLVDSNYHTIIGGSDPSGFASFFIRVENNNKIYAGVRKKSIVAQVGIFSNSTISANTWYYVVLTRVGNTLRLYLDGIQQGVDNTLDVAIENTQNNPCVGRMGSYTGLWYFKGYISDLIVKKGISSNGSVPTTPFQSDPYTKLLLHMDGVGQAFYDSSDPPGDNGFPILPDGVTITPNGTFGSMKGKDGRTYVKFDGSTNYIDIGDHVNWAMFMSNFTISLWVKFDSVSVNSAFMGQWSDNSNCWYFHWDQPNNIISTYGMVGGTQTFRYTCPFTASINTWYHITWVKNGSSCLMYINGVSQTVSVSTAWNNITNIAAPLRIGKIYNITSLNGEIKDMMIFNYALSLDQIFAIMDETFIY